MSQFGDKFRKAREAKGISLDDVSNVTKISARNLQAIEEERFDLLPGGVFNRGFIRAYAKHLGLNGEEAVTDYLACLRQAQIDAHEVWTPEPLAPTPAEISAAAEKRPPYQKPAAKVHEPAVTPAKEDKELPGLQLPRAEHVRPPSQKYLDRGPQASSWRLIAVAAVVIVLALVLWTRHSRATHANATTPIPPPAQTAAIPVSVSPVLNQPTGKNSASAVAPAVAAPSSAKPALATDTNPPQPKTVSQTSATSGTPDSAGSTRPHAEESDVTVRTFTKSGSPAKPAPTMTLVIRATENSWVSVTADGQQVSQETLIAPAHTSVRASREIVARIGNAAGVTFLFNGQEIAASGAEAEVKTFVFDAQGMRETQNQPPIQTH